MEKLQQAPSPLKEKIAAALASQAIPHVYANGFINALGHADIMMVLERNNSPVAVLNMSYTAAKSFAQQLSQAIANLEQKSGQPIMTTEGVDTALSRPTEGQA